MAFLAPLAALILLATTSAALLYFDAPAPFIWIFALAAMLALVATARTPRARARELYLACFGVALALLLLEVALTAYEALRRDRLVKSGGAAYYAPDPSLGYAPMPGSRAAQRLMLRDSIIYDVTYTIGADGLRATKGNSQGESWLFAGCSFVFGEGVNDDETLPSQFSAALDHRANVVNLGFKGYGPHQMLRILETDRARPLARMPVRQVIYEAISDHPRRAAGRASWDRSGPSYELSPTGLTFEGPFHGQITDRLFVAAMRSHVFDFVVERTVFRSTVSDDDIERYGRIVERSAQLAREKFGSAFTILYWDDDSDVSRRTLTRLRATKIPIVLVSEIIPRGEWTRLSLPHDGHPTAEANRRLAVGLVERLAH